MAEDPLHDGLEARPLVRYIRIYGVYTYIDLIDFQEKLSAGNRPPPGKVVRSTTLFIVRTAYHGGYGSKIQTIVLRLAPLTSESWS